MANFTTSQWEHIAGESRKQGRHRTTESVMALLRSLQGVTDGFPVDQLTHACQTATRAERDGAEPEVVIAALCHDVGKAISDDNHAGISAEILKPYVTADVYNVVRFHQDFQLRHYAHHFGGDPMARERHRGKPWFALAERFTDQWDQVSFDPRYDTFPLEHFEPLVRQVLESHR